MRAHVPDVATVMSVATIQRRSSVFFVSDPASQELHATYPPEVIDFDATALPARVLASFAEAIRCHAAGCYVAAAMMVRKTLEVLAEDRAAGGDNLKARLKALRDKVIMPEDLFEAFDDLRMLGNDAAHIEPRTFDDVGQEEVEIAIDVTKEILKATYQYGSLVERLRARRRVAE